MVSSKPSKIFHFILFIVPALLLYSLFFINPLIQGVQYSFTDWNGIVPEVPMNMEKAKFEDVVKKLNKGDGDYLKKYYENNEDVYNLKSWIVNEKGEERQLDDGERAKLKKILKSAGITPINFIGFDNYKEMFKGDIRFVPRFEKNYLFKEYDDLPQIIEKKVFEKNLIANIKKQEEKELVNSKFKYDASQKGYVLAAGIQEGEVEPLKKVLAENMYKNVFMSGVIGFTLFFTFFNVLLSNLFALAIALILDNKMKTTNALRSIFFLPNVLSLIIVAFVWSFVFRLILPRFTGIDIWLGDTNIAPYCVVMVSVWQSCGYLMIIYLAGLQTIPGEILEVAQLDGANWIQRFKNITLPLLIPSITICSFYSLANSLKSFDVAFALTSGGPGYATTAIVLDIYFNAFLQNRFGYGTAKAIFLCLLIMIITGIQLYIMKKKEVEL